MPIKHSRLLKATAEGDGRKQTVGVVSPNFSRVKESLFGAHNDTYDLPDFFSLLFE